MSSPAPKLESPALRNANPMRTAMLILLKATLIYIVLMVAWKPLAPAVASTFRATSNIATAGVYRGAIQIRYTPGTVGQRDADTIVHYHNVKQRTASSAGINISSWYYAYVPLTMILALTLATPIPWKRRLRALILGSIIMFVLIMLGQMLIVYDKLTGVPIASPVQVSQAWDRIIATAASIFAELPGSFFIPIIVYALATFRRWELITLFGMREAQS